MEQDDVLLNNNVARVLCVSMVHKALVIFKTRSRRREAMIGNITFIAEVKTQASSGWRSERSWDELFDIANEHGDWISIHTDARWGGSMKLVSEAWRRTSPFSPRESTQATMRSRPHSTRALPTFW